MRTRKLIGRFTALFAAGFVSAAALATATGTIFAVSAPTVASALTTSAGSLAAAVGIRAAGAAAVETIFGLIGGAVAAAYFGRHKAAD